MTFKGAFAYLPPVLRKRYLQESNFIEYEEWKDVMSRRCIVTGKGVMSGNNVSHAKNRTRRRFLPNVQKTTLYSVALDRWVKMRVSVAGLRTIEHRGGLDAYLTSESPTKLDASLRPVKAQVEKALSDKAA